MTVDRIDPVLVEKVAKAIHNEEWVKKGYGPWEKCVDQDRIRRLAEVEIRVVLDELRLKEERRVIDYEHVRVGEAAIPIEESRLVSDWRLVEQGDE